MIRKLKPVPNSSACFITYTAIANTQMLSTNNNVIGMDWDECRLNGNVSSRIIVPFAGSVYYTPGFQQSAGAWPEFSLPTRRGLGIDGDQDGQTDMSYRDYDPNGTVEEVSTPRRKLRH